MRSQWFLFDARCGATAHIDWKRESTYADADRVKRCSLTRAGLAARAQCVEQVSLRQQRAQPHTLALAKRSQRPARFAAIVRDEL